MTEKQERTAKEYSQALFMLALEDKKELYYSEALAIIDEVLSESPDFEELLASPAIAIPERLSIIDEAFGKSLDEYSVSFLKLLCEASHIRSFKAIRAEYERLLLEHQRRSRAIVTSAVALTENEISALKTRLSEKTGCSVEIECRVDKSVIGGLIIEIDGKIIDGSVKKKIADVKDVIGR